MINYPSKILETAVEQIASLPGIGKRTALRLALHLMSEEDCQVQDFCQAVLRLKTELKHCRICHNVSDAEICPICSSEKRQKGLICVVENVQDVMAIENTEQYRGLYHVLGGVISPIDGVGVHDLEIDSLIQRVAQGIPIHIEEVILALPTTMEGDTTNYYLNKQLRPLGVKVTTLARGVAIGDSLEYADEVTLGRSITGRVLFDG